MLEKIKRLFKSQTSKHGSYSVGMILVVICIVIVINMIAGQLPENIKNIDISDNQIYEITDTSKEMLDKLDSEVTFTVYAEKSSTDERIRTFLKKYEALSDKIDVEWVDPVQHPAELTENNVDSDTILIRCEETGKSTTVAFSDILVVDEYSYYMSGSTSASEFDGEGQLTGAVNYVTSKESGKIYATTGHGEQSFSASVTDLFGKNNMEESELNLLMDDQIPDDCDLLFVNAPTSDFTEDEKDLILSYMSKGGHVFIMLGEMSGDAPNLDAILEEYGIRRVDGYIADMERCYQGNYYYIFPNITATGDMAAGMSSGMILLINAHGLELSDPSRDTITVQDFMSTSDNAYAVTETTQEQGSYVLGAVATESVSSSDEEKESRLTVISADSMIDGQVTDSFSSLENLTLFMNAVSCNFDGVQNLAIEPKSLEITYNTMQYAGPVSILVIFGIPMAILIFGFVKWWKRRKA